MATTKYAQFADRVGQGAEKLLGELELEIMQIVWERQHVTVREVLEALAVERALAYTTVMTVMHRLVEKGLLIAGKEEKTHWFRPAYSRQEFEAQAVGRVVQSLLADFGSDVAIRQFIDRLSEVEPTQLARLAEMARQAQEGQDES
jgi:predicted transcriptional regulator